MNPYAVAVFRAIAEQSCRTRILRTLLRLCKQKNSAQVEWRSTPRVSVSVVLCGATIPQYMDAKSTSRASPYFPPPPPRPRTRFLLWLAQGMPSCFCFPWKLKPKVARRDVYDGAKTLLTIGAAVADSVPPAKAVISGLLAVLKVLEVCGALCM